MFGKLNKRWFKLDVINASFSYASGVSKNASKTIPMWDIECVICEDADKEVKEWQYFFQVKTTTWEYGLYAQNKAERDMWLLAFETLLKFWKE